MLARDEDLLDLHLLEDLGSRGRSSTGSPSCARSPPKIRKSAGGLHRLDLLHRPDGLVDEARVDVLRVEVGVGDPGELEALLRAEGQVEGVDQREPSVGRPRPRRRPAATCGGTCGG